MSESPHARETASAAADEAKRAAGEVRGTAAEQTKAVVGTAREQAMTAADDLRERAVVEAEGQIRRTAGTLRQWADDLAGMAGGAPSDSPARGMAEKAADGGHRAADFLERRGAAGLADELQTFARGHPGAFLGGAALAGLAIGRMAKAGSGAGGGLSDGTGAGSGRAGQGGPERKRTEQREEGLPAGEGGGPARGADWPGLPGRPPEVM